MPEEFVTMLFEESNLKEYIFISCLLWRHLHVLENILWLEVRIYLTALQYGTP